MDNLSDDLLIKQIPQGSESAKAALSILYDRYCPYMIRQAQKAGLSPEDVDTAVQDTFVKVWNSAHQYDAKRGAVSTWLMTITRNTILSLKRKKVPKTVAWENLDLVIATNIHPGSDQFFIKLEVLEFLESLEPEQRLILKYILYGYVYEEIAALIGVSLDVFKKEQAQIREVWREKRRKGDSDESS
jgi:RNA polymerase sigma factor (sigma-70 family)